MIFHCFTYFPKWKILFCSKQDYPLTYPIVWWKFTQIISPKNRMDFKAKADKGILSLLTPRMDTGHTLQFFMLVSLEYVPRKLFVLWFIFYLKSFIFVRFTNESSGGVQILVEDILCFFCCLLLVFIILIVFKVFKLQTDYAGFPAIKIW